MPVRHRDLAGQLSDYGVPEPKRCKHCDAADGGGAAAAAAWNARYVSVPRHQPPRAMYLQAAAATAPPLHRCTSKSRGSCGGSGEGAGAGVDGEGGSWRVTLDHDLVETLSAIYPEWFKPQTHRRAPAPPSDCDEPLTPLTPHTPHTPRSDDTQSSGSSDMAASGSSDGSCASSSDARSPRLSPPRVSPPKAVVDASPLQQAMDRNKESLKMKLMMRRPINQLVAQGIMPPLKTPPAYHEQRIQLERAKTGDLLKAKIQKRPDRQELERRHILELQEGHVDPSLAEKQRMLKKARLADQLNDQLSHRPGPLELIKKNILHTEEPIEDAVKRDLVTFRATSEGTSLRPSHPSSYCVPLDEHSPSPSPPSTLSPASVASPPLLHPAPGKDKNRKSKSKLKQAPKARQIKFHEYKGPPSAQKASTPPMGTAGTSETSYDLLLQQQQLLLQLMINAAPNHSPVASPAASDSSDVHCTPPAPPPPPPPPAPARIEEMKVSELRAECKRHKLRVSGPKPQLIDRLRPFLSEDSPRSPASSLASMSSPDPRADSVERESHPPSQEDSTQSQPRQMEELQRELEAVLREAASVAAAGDQQQGKRLLQAKIYVSRLRAQLEALQQPQQPPPPPPPPPVQPAPRYILTAPEQSPDRVVRLIAVPPAKSSDSSDGDVKTTSPAYILNGVKVVPIAILPSHYEPHHIQATIQAPMQATIQAPMQATIQGPIHTTIQSLQSPMQTTIQTAPPSPATPPPPPLTTPPETSRRLAEDMDDVLEILVKNGELPQSAVSPERDLVTDFLVSEPFSPGEVLSNDDILGDRNRLTGDELQRELNDIQNEILQHADLNGSDRCGVSSVTDDLTVDLLSNDGFATDFSGQNGDAHDIFGSFLRGESERISDEPMDINECARDGIDCVDPDTDVFNIGELSFPPLRDEDMSGHAVFGDDSHADHNGIDFKDFGLELDCDTNMSVAPSDPCDFMELDVIPNLFGRGHQPQCDPLLGGVLSRPAPRPTHLLYSWDKIDYDGT